MDDATTLFLRRYRRVAIRSNLRSLVEIEEQNYVISTEVAAE
jgi:hypothetical protein